MDGIKVLLATSNPHKVEEIGAIFGDCTREESGQDVVELVGLKELGISVPEPVEDQESFEGNAVKKALYYARTTGWLVLAEDSGLEVEVLGGEPGVRSARYAGVTGPRREVDEANNRFLLEKLAKVPLERRGAQFVCVMALAVPVEGREVEVRAMTWGRVRGRILLPEEAENPDRPWCGRGKNGFGYDPLFLVPELGRTTAELAREEKNRISHRSRAARRMWKLLRWMSRGGG